MNNSKMVMLAVVLIVAVPICLGYALSFNEVERTGYETGEKVNITDMMLNNQTPYYMDSTSPVNNSEFLVRATYPGSGVTETTLKAPNFVSVSDNYSSLPIYESGSATYELDEAARSETEGWRYQDLYSAIRFGREIPANQAYYYFTTSQMAQMNSTPGIMSTTFGPFLFDGSKWVDSSGHTITGTYNDEWIVSDRFPTYTIVSRPFTDLNIDSDSYSMDFNGVVDIKLTLGNGNTQYIQKFTGTTNVTKTGNTAIIGGVTYSGVSKVSVAPVAGMSSVQYTYTQQTGEYANPAYGWKIPTITGAATWPYWFNGQVNESVRMMIHIEAGESAYIYPKYNDTTAENSYILISRASNGQVYASTNDGALKQLGNFAYLCLDLTGKDATVGGMNAWPVMGGEPNIINSVKVDFAATMPNFSRIYINSSFNDIEYRVDKASILAGYFPSTKDYTLNMASYWGANQDFGVALNSVGIYGSSITFGGQNMTVTDGKIDGTPLLNALFSSTYDADLGVWINSINGDEVNQTDAPATITFNGEWSLTAAAYKVQEATGTELKWQPGVFAFEALDNSFALIGLLVCGGVFIALGMFGRRSGAKVGLLMAVCGGFGLVFLLLI